MSACQDCKHARRLLTSSGCTGSSPAFYKNRQHLLYVGLKLCHTQSMYNIREMLNAGLDRSQLICRYGDDLS